MDNVGMRLAAMKFEYGDADDAAYAEISKRVVDAARRQTRTLTYTQAASGIAFRLPQLRQNPHLIDVVDWPIRDRNIIASFLGRLSAESYARGGFLASAVVVSKDDKRPGEGFFNLARDAGILSTNNADRALQFWIDELTKAIEWFDGNEW